MIDLSSKHIEWFFELELPADFPRGVYVLLTSEIPREYRAKFALGYFTADLDEVFRDYLTAAKRWDGRKPAMVVDDVEIRRIAADPFCALGAGAGRYIRERTIGVTIHEAAHALELPADTWDRSPTESSTTTAERVIEWAGATSQPEKPVPWFGHGKRFIRAAVHLHARAVATDFGCQLRTVARLENYRLSSLEAYAETLAAELKQSAESLRSIREILDEPEPSAFAELWQSDTERVLQTLVEC